MAASPDYKVYDRKGTYQAACKDLFACAALMVLYGEGSTVRLGHSIVLWTEGSEADTAYNSYDAVVQTCQDRQAESDRRWRNNEPIIINHTTGKLKPPYRRRF